MTSHHHHSAPEPWRSLPEGFAERLELEAELSIPVRAAALEYAARALGAAPAAIVDLGSGTGADAVALAEYFPTAAVHAVDVSAELLARVAAKASAVGVTDRIHTHRVDLNDDWTAETPRGIDLAWASLSLHHLNDPAEALRRVFASLHPGGVFVLTEMMGDESFESGVAGGDDSSAADQRHHGQAVHGRHREHDWAQLLADAGFVSLQRHVHDMVARGDTATGIRYLEMLQHAGLPDDPTEEVATNEGGPDELTSGASDAAFRSGRVVWTAVRPSRESLETRDTDVAVIGGGPAGLAAAIALARSRRNVVLVDAGEPRNAPAEGAHNVLGNEGIAPLELIARGRAEAESYGVQIVSGRVSRVSGQIDDFTVEVGEGAQRIRARRVILATGLVDDLPDVPGVAAGWGSTVLHCPFCHGWEVRDQRIAILARQDVPLHQAMLFRQLSDRVTLFLHEASVPTAEQWEQLAALKVDVVTSRVRRLRMEHTRVRAVEMEDGSLFDADAVVVSPRFNVRTELYEMLGGIAGEGMFGAEIPVDPRGQTAVSGVWVAGNAGQPMAMVVASSASGMMTGAAVHGDLALSELNAAVSQRALESADQRAAESADSRGI
ncbi:FAD-dependent oxidoreductase [Microbacterium esteraromaticum]|nr:FAD-dependent oxidoreductase [Microbacterium esteraromaticum]